MEHDRGARDRTAASPGHRFQGGPHARTHAAPYRLPALPERHAARPDRPRAGAVAAGQCEARPRREAPRAGADRRAVRAPTHRDLRRGAAYRYPLRTRRVRHRSGDGGRRDARLAAAGRRRGTVGDERLYRIAGARRRGAARRLPRRVPLGLARAARLFRSRAGGRAGGVRPQPRDRRRGDRGDRFRTGADRGDPRRGPCEIRPAEPRVRSRAAVRFGIARARRRGDAGEVSGDGGTVRARPRREGARDRGGAEAMTDLRMNDGRAITAIGFGSYLVPPERAKRIARDAVAAGYRLADTAALYANEAEVAAGIEGHGVFLTTKLWRSELGYDSALRGFDASLGRVGRTRA